MPAPIPLGWCVIPGDDTAHYLYRAPRSSLVRSKCGKLIARWDFIYEQGQPHCVWCEKVRQYDKEHSAAK